MKCRFTNLTYFEFKLRHLACVPRRYIGSMQYTFWKKSEIPLYFSSRPPTFGRRSVKKI